MGDTMRPASNVIDLVEVEKGVWEHKREQSGAPDYFGMKLMFFLLVGYAAFRLFEYYCL
jgi:hypothetical protein